MKHLLQHMLICLGLGLGQAGFAQDEGLHRITGFRSATFGMGVEAVRAAIQRDFALGPAAIREVLNSGEATTVLSITLPSLEPGPGTAQVSYIFGATSRRLMHVNVVWSTDGNPTDDEREAIAIAGLQLARYFTERQWKPDGKISGVMSSPHEVLLFAGIDPADAGVELLVQGVAAQAADGSTTTPAGPATLKLAYMQRMGQPDIVKVTDGAF